MANPYLGEIRMFAFNFAPQGWALCNGQTLSINQNQAVFALLGTLYGGNGTTTFQLPNLQSRVAIHQGQGAGLSPYVVGQQGGVENVTLTSGQMPAHNHLINCDDVPEDVNGSNPSGKFLGATYDNTGGPVDIYSKNLTPAPATMNPSMVAIAGGSQPHQNVQPYLAVTFCIALQGIFPSRN